MNDIKQFTDINGVTHDIKDYRISSIVDVFYPIGSIYLTVNSANPAVLFGGEWKLVPGRFLLGTGAPEDNTNNFWGYDVTYDGTNKYNESAGTLGGEARHTLTEGELPEHAHAALGKPGDPNTASWRFPIQKDIGNVSGWHSGITNASAGSGITVPGCLDNQVTGNIGLNQYTGAVGNNVPHNNLPPYYAVYMWQRIA